MGDELRITVMNDEEFRNYIDETHGEGGDEHRALGDTKDKFSYTYQITINLKPQKMKIVEMICFYKELWQRLAEKYRSTKHLYFVEYCLSGTPHIHGYLQVDYPYAFWKYDEKFFLDEINRTIFMMLPKHYWMQYTKKIKYLPFSETQTPAVHVALRNILSTNWENYIQKNALKI